MTRTHLILIAAGGSLALLAGAFIAQYVFGLAPCEMCLWQRWPHAAAILIGLAALALPGPVLPLLGALAACVTAGIGVFHVGVEQQWWQGITGCTGTDGIAAVPIADLLNPNIEAGPPLVRCDQATYVGPISMAAWNALLSFGLAAVWLVAARGRA